MYYYKFVGNRVRMWGHQNGLNNLDGFTCRVQEKVPWTEIFDHVGAPVLTELERATSGMIVSTVSSEWVDDVGAMDGTQVHSSYYGDAADPHELAVLRPRVTPRKWRVKPKSKARQFQLDVARGKIIFQNYSIGTAEITEVPGFDPRDLTGAKRVSYTRNIGGYVRDQYVGFPCYGEVSPTRVGLLPYKGMGVTAPAIQNTGEQATPSYPLTSDYDRFTVRPDAIGIYPTDRSPGLIAAIDSFLLDLQKPKPIPGLVTSVQCEANKGAWDALTSIMENIRETLPMIFRALQSAMQLQQSARGKIRNRRSLSQGNAVADIASIWLWYRYAVQPLAYDIKNLLDYMEREFKEYRSYRRGRTHTLEFEHDGWTGSIEAVDRCLIRHEYDYSHFDGMMFNKWRTAWELLPLRFIVDWFVNVGDVLVATQPPTHAKQIKQTYSTRVKGNLILTHPEYPGRVVISIDSYARGLNNNLSYTDIEFRPNMSWQRYADAMAIFWAGVKHPLRYR